jgi:hypothetical protein
MEYVLLMGLFWSIAASGPKILNFDGDLPRHLLLGQLIRESKGVPLTDTFSFRTEGFPSIPHEWLSQVIFSISNDLLGLSGVVLLTALIVTATWAIVFQEAKQRTNNLFALIILTVLGIAASMIHVLPRPHLFTYLFTALWVVVLERIISNKPHFWWLLPVLMILWVNLHGMFVVGIIIWGIYLLGGLFENPSRLWFSTPSTEALLIGGGLTVAATFLSPSGLKIWEAITSLGSNTYITSRIPEYQSADFHLPETWPFILLLILTVAAFARTTHRIRWTYILLTISFTGIALYTSRMIPLFAMVVVPIAAKTVGDWLGQEFSSSRFSEIEKNISTINSSSSGIVWMIIIFLTVVVVFESGKTIDPGNKGNLFDEDFFPVQAVNWLNLHPQQGHMFNEFDWGGYLLLNLSPPQQIFMDGHTHIYGEILTREYETIVTLGDGWRDILDKYQIEWMIVRSGSQVARALENNNWELLYQDETAIILHRQ